MLCIEMRIITRPCCRGAKLNTLPFVLASTVSCYRAHAQSTTTKVIHRDTMSLTPSHGCPTLTIAASKDPKVWSIMPFGVGGVLGFSDVISQLPWLLRSRLAWSAPCLLKNCGLPGRPPPNGDVRAKSMCFSPGSSERRAEGAHGPPGKA